MVAHTKNYAQKKMLTIKSNAQIQVFVGLISQPIFHELMVINIHSSSTKSSTQNMMISNNLMYSKNLCLKMSDVVICYQSLVIWLSFHIIASTLYNMVILKTKLANQRFDSKIRQDKISHFHQLACKAHKMWLSTYLGK